MTLWLSEDDVRSLVTPGEAVPAPGEGEDWDEERLGYQERFFGDAA